MTIIALAIEVSKLAILAIILFYVVGMLSMPENMKRVVQALIILIAIFAAVQLAVGAPLSARNPVTHQLVPLSPEPNIIAPERR